MGLRVELFAEVRRDARVDGLSIRALAELSYSRVWDYVRVRRAPIDVEAGAPIWFSLGSADASKNSTRRPLQHSRRGR